jgi:hypothetical protein|tara:strand:+ start:15218 stop:15802 length:585 start_codon:yes stop_codon:yes gene_type:complete
LILRNIANQDIPIIKMKYVIRIVLFVIIATLAYLNFNTVDSDIKYTAEVEMRENAVIEKLSVLKEGQLAYKYENKMFADNFDDLLDFMENGQKKIIIQSGSADDSTTVVEISEKLVSVKELLFSDVDIAKLRYLPFHADSVEFKIASGEIDKNNVTVPVFEIKDTKPFSKDRQKNDNPLKVGSIFEANYNGNWD